MNIDKQPDQETPPVSEHQRWLDKVRSLETRRDTMTELHKRAGIDSDIDPDYQFVMGQLHIAQNELIGHAAISFVEQADEQID